MTFQIVKFLRFILWHVTFIHKGLIFAAACIVLFIFTVATPVHANYVETEYRQKEIAYIVAVDGFTSHSPQLLTAIRAQLSASKIVIRKHTIPMNNFDVDAPGNSLIDVARSVAAPIVFFIRENKNVCTIKLYISGAPQGKFFIRSLEIDSENLTSRFETIANAVSSMLEDTSFQPQQAPSQESRTAEATSSTLKKVSDSTKDYYSVVALFYRGEIFTGRRLIHGVGLSVGVSPFPHLVFGISYHHNLSLKWATDSYQFILRSGAVTASFSTRFVKSAFELQPGISWRTTFRSYSVTKLENSSQDSNLQVRRPDSNAVHALEPFCDIAWQFHKGVWLALRAGASVSLNEKKYVVSRRDGSQKNAAEPHRIKPIYMLGVVFQL